MKKILKISALTLAFILIFTLAACNGILNNSGNTNSTDGGSGTTLSGDELNGALEQAKDWAHDQGWDGEGYLFPQVENIREWPPSTVWTELGLPELKPDSLTDGNIYNDGNTHIDGYSDVFIAECKTSADSFSVLAQKLWDSGIKGTNIGGGRIIPAEDIEWLLDDEPNYLWYRAYYEYKGDVMEVYLQYTNGWDTTLWVGVKYAPSDPNFEQYPKISYPSAEIKNIIGVDLPNPGGTIYGIVNKDGYTGIELVIEGVSRTDYDQYVKNLQDGKTAGIIEDQGDMSTDIHGYYGKVFYPENYDNHPSYIDVNYVGGIMFISIIAL